MNKIYQHLKLIENRIPMYIGSNTLHDLNVYINGFDAALYLVGQEENYLLNDLNNFVSGFYNGSTSALGWNYLINEYMSDETEQNKIYQFYHFLDHYYTKNWIDKAFKTTEKSIIKDDEFYNTFKRPEFIPESSFNVMIQLFNGYLLSNIEAGNFNIMEAMISFIRYIADDKIFDAKNWDKLITDEYGTEEEACNYFYNKLDEFYNKCD